ncbi:DNA replication and repair protein RecF [Arthrobacter sp. Hiyo4]|nr:DNA replication and repair protein RecF [Arthrobacter sp. Hiyo4]
MELLSPHLAKAYAQLTDGSKDANALYRSTLQNLMDDDGGAAPGAGGGSLTDGSAAAEDLRDLTVEDLTGRYVQAFAASRRKELERGISLVGRTGMSSN